MPNAGWPTHSGGRVIYPSSAEYFAEFARNALKSGINLIGGCCGTTPEHTRAMRAVIDEWLGSDAASTQVVQVRPARAVDS